MITKWSNESEESLLYDSTKPLSYSCSGIEMFVKGGCRGYKLTKRGWWWLLGDSILISFISISHFLSG